MPAMVRPLAIWLLVWPLSILLLVWPLSILLLLRWLLLLLLLLLLRGLLLSWRLIHLRRDFGTGNVEWWGSPGRARSLEIR